jgi:hypothetical protein
LRYSAERSLYQAQLAGRAPSDACFKSFAEKRWATAVSSASPLRRWASRSPFADGSIAIEQTKTDLPAAAVPKVESHAVAISKAIPASGVVTQRAPPLSEDVDDSAVRGGSGAGNFAPGRRPYRDLQEIPVKAAPVIDEREQTPDRPSRLGSNGPAETRGKWPPGRSGISKRFRYSRSGFR